MKKYIATPSMIKAKIEFLEYETKRLTNKKSMKRQERVRIFDILSNQWLATYMCLNDLSKDLPDYEKYIHKLGMLEQMMADYAILGR